MSDWKLLSEEKPEHRQHVMVYPVHMDGVYKDEPKHVLRWYGGKYSWEGNGAIYNLPPTRNPKYWRKLPDYPKV